MRFVKQRKYRNGRYIVADDPSYIPAVFFRIFHENGLMNTIKIVFLHSCHRV